MDLIHDFVHLVVRNASEKGRRESSFVQLGVDQSGLTGIIHHLLFLSVFELQLFALQVSNNIVIQQLGSISVERTWIYFILG